MEHLEKTFAAMRHAFPDAMIKGFPKASTSNHLISSSVTRWSAAGTP
jgi:hypothetical protein